ncbi:expressed unknown protein [Seminavis robusta]|uniref:Mechanosensitive ion channel MscS domain-containing protein n=1 Tax=Seminavis robusta TaxID=568900 RepID=A0A9N8DNR9_9STRA|nr:expressed unknown protein [Seminavis robusta]|eukprot:Sro232_g093880.1 n/a (589) ;mRNA; r:40382-42248
MIKTDSKREEHEEIFDHEEPPSKEETARLLPLGANFPDVVFEEHLQNDQATEQRQGLVGLGPLTITLVLFFLSIVVPEFIFRQSNNVGLFQGLTDDMKYSLVRAAFAMPPMFMFLNWAFFHVSVHAVILLNGHRHRDRDGEDENEKKNAGGSSALRLSKRPKRQQIIQPENPNVWKSMFQINWAAGLLTIIIIITYLKLIASTVIREEFQENTIRLLNLSMGFTLLVGWISFLEGLHDGAHGYADRVENILQNNQKLSKLRSIVSYSSSFQDLEVDVIHGIPGGIHSRHPHSPARVLANVLGIYVLLGEFVGLFLLLLYFIGVDLYENIVVVGLSVLFTVVLTALHLGEAVGSLVPLVLSNSIHVGEIISVTRPGFKPGNDPKEFITGFVEGITLGHVVVRDFTRKQVHIPHSEFRDLVLTNWSRRPTKTCHFCLHVQLGLVDAAVPLAQLASFLKRWIDAHPGIDKENYIKSVAKMRSEGQALEVIFYPVMKYDANQLRAEFLVAVAGAAKRLDICILPVEMRIWYPPGCANGDSYSGGGVGGGAREQQGEPLREDDPPDPATVDTLLEDLMPSESLTKKAGYPPSS